MQALNSIPGRPLTIDEVLSYRTHNRIAHAAPLVGRNPNPRETVVAMYVGIGQRSLWAMYESGDASWVAWETDTSPSDFDAMTDIMDDVISWLGDQEPDASLAVLQPAGGMARERQLREQ